jgi:hypothetical protein
MLSGSIAPTRNEVPTINADGRNALRPALHGGLSLAAIARAVDHDVERRRRDRVLVRQLEVLLEPGRLDAVGSLELADHRDRRRRRRSAVRMSARRRRRTSSRDRCPWPAPVRRCRRAARTANPPTPRERRAQRVAERTGIIGNAAVLRLEAQAVGEDRHGVTGPGGTPPPIGVSNAAENCRLAFAPIAPQLRPGQDQRLAVAAPHGLVVVDQRQPGFVRSRHPFAVAANRVRLAPLSDLPETARRWCHAAARCRSSRDPALPVPCRAGCRRSAAAGPSARASCRGIRSDRRSAP